MVWHNNINWNKRYKLYIYQKIRCCRQLAWEPPRVCTWWTERSQEHYQCLTLWLVSRPLLLSGLYWGASRRLTILPPHLYSALCKAEVVRQSKEIILIRAHSPPLPPPISEIIYKLFHKKIKHQLIVTLIHLLINIIHHYFCLQVYSL